jgi:hypothetical protein
VQPRQARPAQNGESAEPDEEHEQKVDDQNGVGEHGSGHARIVPRLRG